MFSFKRNEINAEVPQGAWACVVQESNKELEWVTGEEAKFSDDTGSFRTIKPKFNF